jgi:hypothetical protein
MKHEWKNQEKAFYSPKCKPELITIPEFKFFTIEGSGNPNDDAFPEYVGVLYSLAYAVKMSPKKGLAPEGYFDYSVYPLEGIWDISEEAKKNFTGVLNKDELVFKLMIRQPDFVDEAYADKTIELMKSKKPNGLLSKVKFEPITDGLCIQMMHIGSFDNEPASFALMEEFSASQKLRRKSMVHREIYLSDARKTAAEKLKTVLRFQVKQ